MGKAPTEASGFLHARGAATLPTGVWEPFPAEEARVSPQRMNGVEVSQGSGGHPPGGDSA